MRLLDAKEATETPQVNIQRVYELSRRGILPSMRIGPKQIRYEETRLMKWIEYGGRSMRRAWKQSSLPRNRFPEVALVRQAVEAETVAATTRAVKYLRCASMNSANLNPFA